MAQVQSTSITGSFIVGDTAYTGSAGAIWYDKADGRLKYSYDVNAWSAGGAMITARRQLAGAGTQNEGLAFGGGTPVGACTEEYNGTSWSTGGALATSRRYLAGAGTQNEGLAFGGSPGGACTEEYNGTSWGAGGALITLRAYLAGTGTQNEGLAFGGFSPSPAPTGTTVACTEEYNGTSWSAGGALITARYGLGGAGTQNEALAFGGATPAVPTTQVTCTEEYNGTSWSSGGSLITAGQQLGGAGTQNAGLAFGLYNSNCGPAAATRILGCTQKYDGISWTSTTTLSTARYALAGAGTQTAGLAAGGHTSASTTVTCTEEYVETVAICTL